MVVFGKKWLTSGNSGCTRAKLLYLDKSGCMRANVVVFRQKVFLFGQKLLYSGQSGCIRAKWLYSGNVVLFGKIARDRQKNFSSGKVVVLGKKLM